MNRRVFLVAAAVLPVLGWVGISRAEPAKPPRKKVMRVGLLRVGSAPAAPGPLTKAFIDTMRGLGWVEGRNIVYDYAYADDETRLPEVAAALVERRPDAFYTTTTQITRAAFGATRTIPIVFTSVAEPVEAGLAKTLSRPGGNVTGIALFRGELGARRMQLLREVLPGVRRVGVLVGSVPGVYQEQKLIEQAAGAAVKVFAAMVKAPADLPGALAGLVEAKPDALLLTQDSLFLNRRKVILDFAGEYRIPVIGHFSQLVDDGALFSYNSSLPDHHRRAAQMVDKVLRGAKPADIPIEQPTKFELVVNLRTAKALGIAIPQSVLLQADRVIE